MGIPKSHPIRFTPKGLVDAFDATDKFPGACQSLANLVFDGSNPELVVPRPGVVTLANLATLGFANPTFISVFATIGTRVYGMVATSRNAGKDEPFCYDTATGLSVVIAGVAAGNTPTSPATTGAWTPPTIAQVGVYILITHPGFNGAGTNFFGVIDVTNPAAPAWSSQNVGTNPLPSVPVAVANFNNRAWFVVANLLHYTDVLSLVRTNATQQLTIGDSALVNALAGLPMQTTSSGVIAALTAFKDTQIWQVTGDTTTLDLSLNFLSLTIGTSFPRSLAQSPAGLYFLSRSGPYFIDPLGSLRPLTSNANTMDADVQTPFVNAQTPTRWASAYTANVYRACGPTVVGGANVTNDYWFDERRRRWNGPHSFVFDCASALGGYFVLSSVSAPGKLLQSQATQQLDSLFTDLGAAYSVTVLSSTFPKIGDMCMKQVVESQIELGGAPLGAAYTISAQDEAGNAVAAPNSSLTLTIPASSSNLWGSGLWGSIAQGGSGRLWSSAQRSAPRTYEVPWTSPLVFEKMQLSISAIAGASVAIGTFYARYQKTGYMTLGPTT